MPTDAHVILIDDDPSVRRSLSRLIRSAGLKVKAFASGQEFLCEPLPPGPCCLVLDVQLPGLDGLGLQSKLAEAGVRAPIIFITGHGDIPMSVRAMKAGAVDFLPKPFRGEDLLLAVGQAINRDRDFKREQGEIAALEERSGHLTPREREVFALVVRGMMNKTIAARLGIGEKTIKVHRARVMRKMQAASLVELADMARRLGLNEAASEARVLETVKAPAEAASSGP